MLFLILFLELAFFFLSSVAALNITVQSATVVGQPSLVLWTRGSNDGNGSLSFDLRFVKPDNKDVGLALANIQAPQSTESGTVQVVFNSPGSFLLVAVSGPKLTKLGQSDRVKAFEAPTSSVHTPTSQPAPSATSSAALTSTASDADIGKKNLGFILAGTLGGVALLGLVAAVVVYFQRRRQKTENKRWTFHRDKMIVPPVIDIRRMSHSNSQSSSPEDIERQGGLSHDNNNNNNNFLIRTTTTSSNVMMATPSGPRPLPDSHFRPLPPPPPVAPLKPHQEDMVEQMEQIRSQMAKLYYFG